MPTASIPRMRGNWTGEWPWRVNISERLRPKARMRIRTSFARGWGIGRWRSLRTLGGPGVDMTMAFMVDMLTVLSGFRLFEKTKVRLFSSYWTGLYRSKEQLAISNSPILFNIANNVVSERGLPFSESQAFALFALSVCFVCSSCVAKSRTQAHEHHSPCTSHISNNYSKYFVLLP